MNAPLRDGSDAVLARLSRLHPKIIDLSLGRVERLLARLDHPEVALPPVVHVAGTNGKGSLIAFLRAMLEAAGLRVHVYTSPHLVRFHERVRLAGQLIDEERLLALLEECEAANGSEPITYFEITTVAAFLAFAREPADVLLLETGLGGRLDATNMVAQPRLTAITPVSMDHMQFLGDSLPAIAGEKAGILKPGVACVVGEQAPEARDVMLARGAEVGAPILMAGRDWQWRREGERLIVEGEGGLSADLPLPRLIGRHQLANAAQAVVCAKRLGDLSPADRFVGEGLGTVEWPARFQRLRSGPLFESLNDGWRVWLDGGHNGAAGGALAEVLKQDNGNASAGPLHLVFGMLNTKTSDDFLRPFVGLAESLTAVAIPGELASLSAEDAADAGRRVGLKAATAGNVPAAVRQIAEAHPQDRPPGRILICGSLYLAGQVLRDHG